MFDKDGQFKFSGIIIIFTKSTGKIAIYLNPVESICSIYTGNKKLLDTTAMLLDQQSRALCSILIRNEYQLKTISEQSSGIYFLKFENGEVIKIIKQ